MWTHPPKHRYQFSESAQTLAEGLAEFRAAFPGLKCREALSPAAQAFFTSHDTVHVIYGCGTSMTDEAVVKLASLFGTSGGLSILSGYILHDSMDTYRRLPLGGTLAAMLLAPYLLARTLWRCTRQRVKWPWIDHDQYMHMPLRDLRARFGIKVTHRQCKAD